MADPSSHAKSSENGGRRGPRQPSEQVTWHGDPSRFGRSVVILHDGEHAERPRTMQDARRR